MSIKIGHNGNREISLDQCQLITCGCGCNDFEQVPIVFAYYDKLRKNHIVMSPQATLKCHNCGLYLTFDEQKQEWITRHPVYVKPESVKQ